MGVYNNVAGGVSKSGVRVVISVVEEPQGCIVGLFGGLRLLVREVAKGNEYGWINGDVVIEECADYLLHEVDGLWGKQGGGGRSRRRIGFWSRRWGLNASCTLPRSEEYKMH